MAKTSIKTPERAGLKVIHRGMGLGRLLLLAREDFFQRMERATAHLFDATTLRVCSPLLPFLDAGGVRSVEVARRMGVSKQAVGPKIAALVERGLVECVADPDDRRAFLIQVTPSGQKFMADVVAAIRRVEGELERELGADRLRVLREALTHMAYGPSRNALVEETAQASPRRSGRTARGRRLIGPA
jgi:DNA-binding MarR family transcriptional regulator